MFGQALASDGVGVFSFSRYALDPQTGDFPLPWAGAPPNGSNYGESKGGTQKKKSGLPKGGGDAHVAVGGGAGGTLLGTVLRRSCAVLTHEVGHLFGLKHCVYFECLMNGSNSSKESEIRPIHLCPVCLKKLQSSVGFDPRLRARALIDMFGALGWKEDEAWTRNWLGKVEGDGKCDGL